MNKKQAKMLADAKAKILAHESQFKMNRWFTGPTELVGLGNNEAIDGRFFGIEPTAPNAAMIINEGDPIDQ